MSGFHLLRAADRKAQPWKNGGGVTREVIVHPPGAGMEDFLWRVSLADVDEAGAFSRFDGIDRVLAVLEGQLELDLSGELLMLDPSSPPAGFAGDMPASGRPLGGEKVRDLNLMLRRGVVRGSMGRADTLATTTTAVTTILLAELALSLSVDGAKLDLAALDAVVLAPGHVVVAEGPLVIVTIEAA